MKAIKAPQLLVIVAVALLALTGCVSSEKATEQGTPASTHAAALSIKDPWVKSADGVKSAAFGTLQNSGAADITVVSASTAVSTAVELHETVPSAAGEMVMRKKAGGFVIPAGGSLRLAPGASHIMIMGLTAPLKAGDQVAFTLTLSDGSTYQFTAPGKDYSGANESYEGGTKTGTGK